jgi:hypothetical protein
MPSFLIGSETRVQILQDRTFSKQSFYSMVIVTLGLRVGLFCHFNVIMLSAIYLFDPAAPFAGQLTPTEQSRSLVKPSPRDRCCLK